MVILGEGTVFAKIRIFVETQNVLRITNGLAKQQLRLRIGGHKKRGQNLFQDSDHEEESYLFVKELTPFFELFYTDVMVPWVLADNRHKYMYQSVKNQQVTHNAFSPSVSFISQFEGEEKFEIKTRFKYIMEKNAHKAYILK